MMKTDSVNIKEVSLGYQYRMKPNVFLKNGKRVFDQIRKEGHSLTTVDSLSRDIFRPGIFKRVFVYSKDYGHPYITAQGLMMEDPRKTQKLLSRKHTVNINYMAVHKNDILVSCAGTIGNVRFIGDFLDGFIASQDIIRVIPNDNPGFLYAYLRSSYVYDYLQSLLYGSVVSRIEPETVKGIPIPVLDERVVSSVERSIRDSADMRDTAISLYDIAMSKLLEYSGLGDINLDEYDYYGPHPSERELSSFSINRSQISSLSINAFNLSNRIRNLAKRIENTIDTKSLNEVLDQDGLFSTGSFPRVEVECHRGIELINQKDIFDANIKGKYISKRGVKVSNLVTKDEIIIAGVGTLGENETFCRCVYGNKYLQGKLISGEFIRMKAASVPSGYLYLWLSSNYGFRLIRNCQAGTKLCRPVPRLLEKIPIPILPNEQMGELDAIIKQSQDLFASATFLERDAISLVEMEIQKLLK